jgi:hypothetical protein
VRKMQKLLKDRKERLRLVTVRRMVKLGKRERRAPTRRETMHLRIIFPKVKPVAISVPTRYATTSCTSRTFY